MRGNKAHQQARRGARIAHVERGRRLEEPADTDAVNMPAARVLFDFRAHGTEGRRRRKDIFAFEQSLNY